MKLRQKPKEFADEELEKELRCLFEITLRLEFELESATPQED